MLKQLSIYAENRKSTLKNITGILEAEQINILGSVTNDSAEYGIVRMVVSEPDKAAQALEKEGYLCKLTDRSGSSRRNRESASSPAGAFGKQY